MNSIATKSSRVARTIGFIAGLNVHVFTVLFAVVGAVIYFYGMWSEVHGERLLQMKSGTLALVEYRELVRLQKLSLAQYFWSAATFKLNHFGAVPQTIGAALVYVGVIGSATVIFSARLIYSRSWSTPTLVPSIRH